MGNYQLSDIEIETYRKKLVGLAYRMVGSVEAAEDIAQDALLKFFATNQESIRSPIAWLYKVTVRLAMDYLKSAKVSREEYIGPWLPEPFVHNDSPNVDESISVALMIVLERLTPAERAAYILHDIFSYKHSEIAKIIDMTSINSRQLVSRSRKKIKSNKIKYKSDPKEYSELISAFFAAVKIGDIERLQSVLSTQVVFHADGGGKATAARKIIEGASDVAKFVMNVLSNQFGKETNNMQIMEKWFNGSPGIIIMEQGKTVTAFNFLVVKKKITAIYAVRNPDKLKQLN